MKKTKLIRILAAFNTSELHRLKDFVVSPYFNKNEKIQALFEFIITFAPNFDNNELTGENAFKYIFNGEEYKEQVITKIASKLFKLIQNFTHIEINGKNKLLTDISFLTFLSEKELIRDYTQHLKNVKKRIDNVPMRDAQYFYEQFLIEQELSKLQSSRSDAGIGDVNYQAAVNALDKYYLVQKLVYLCLQFSRKLSTQQQNYSFELMAELEAYIPESPYYEIPTIKIWYTTLQLLKAKDKKAHYFQLRELVFHHFKELNTFEIRNVFSNIQNNARFVFEKKEDYYNELFALYNFQLQRSIFDNPSIFTPNIFFNMITAAILLNKLSWVSQFLSERTDYSAYREDDVWSLGAAMLAFEEGRYPEAQDYLNDCVLRNIYFKLSEKRLRLKVYFELDIFDLIDDHINSFRKFLSINNKSISDLHLQANRGFVNITKHIFYLQKGDIEKIKSLEIEMDKIPVLPEKRWLLEKVEALKK